MDDDNICNSNEEQDGDHTSVANRVGRPSLSQVNTMIQFMKEHPDLAHQRLKCGKNFYLHKKLWIELSNMVNSMEGVTKSTKGWRKFWSDKRRNILLKDKQIREGKLAGRLSELDLKILRVGVKRLVTRRSRKIKEQSCNGDATETQDNSLIVGSDDEDDVEDMARTESNERHLSIMDKLVGVMGQQATSLLQMAQAQLDSTRSMEQLAEASHMQACAVDRIATAFESIGTFVHHGKNSVLGIDATMKRGYPRTVIMCRQDSELFR